MRLIDPDKLRDDILHDSDYDNDTINHFIDLVDEQPEIEAEPVIRCKDCKHHCIREGRIMCNIFFDLLAVSENHYCSYGVKGENNETD